MMYRLSGRSFDHFRKGRTILLAFLWTLGFFSGSALFLYGKSDFSSLMRSIPYSAVSIVSLVFSLLVPFLFVYLAAAADHPLFLYILSFSKPFLFGFCSIGLIFGCGDSGWLWRLFLLFPDLLCAPLLYWFLRRNLSSGAVSYGDGFLLLTAYLLIGILFTVYILPFGADIGIL